MKAQKQPRLDESLALERLSSYFKDNHNQIITNVSYEPNGTDTAPDYTFYLENNLINLEITNSGFGFSLRPENLGETEERDELSIHNFTEELKKSIKLWIKPEETLILITLNSVPQQGRRKLANKIVNLLKKAYLNGELSENKKPFTIPIKDPLIQSLNFEILLTTYYKNKSEYSALILIPAGNLTSSDHATQNNLSFQAKYMLEEAIKEKMKKLNAITGEKWLILINNHPCMNYPQYRQAYDELSTTNPTVTSTFFKIFVIINGDIQEITINIVKELKTTEQAVNNKNSSRRMP